MVNSDWKAQQVYVPQEININQNEKKIRTKMENPIKLNLHCINVH